MSFEGQKFHPGEGASAGDLAKLAGEYRGAAETLRPTGRRRAPLSYWPYRLLAIHAIELYLSAYLLERGQTTADIRSLQHNLAERTDRAVKSGLKLKKLTADHLRRMTDNREYLVARYETEPAGGLSQLNRMEATLKEVAKKVEAAVSRE